MRKAALAFGSLVTTVILAAGLFLAWTVLFRPRMRPLTNRTFAATPQRLERGRYLVETVAVCLRCHSPNDGLAPVAGTEGSGYRLPLPSANPLKHRIVAPNITSDRATGIGAWTDDEIGRAIREGVDRNGRSFGYLMPCGNYHYMGDEDLASVVVYLRTLPPISNALPTTKLIFPVPFLVRLVPVPLTSPVVPDLSNAERRGQYLLTVATCDVCHSPHDHRGHLIEGLDFAGGDVLRVGASSPTATNLTPDTTGLQLPSTAAFRDVMRTGRMAGRSLHPLMPYTQYAKLTDADLDDMFSYLRSVKAVRHVVDATAAPTLCRVCKNQHGGGDRNN